MRKIIEYIGSMKVMAVLMLIFAVASGVATFIENDFGTMTAKAEIYNARWFEILLGVLALNLLINMFRFNMFQKKKALVALFHVSFLVILLGAAVTRYVGYEGMMHIREGETENRITSSQSYLTFNFTVNGQQSRYEMPIYLSQLSSNRFEKRVSVNDAQVDIIMKEYIPNASYQLVEDPDGKPIANLMITGNGAPERIQLTEGEFYETPEVVLDFNSGRSFDKPVIALFTRSGKLHMNHPMPLNYLKMDDQSSGELPVNPDEEVATRTLFTMGETNFVLRDFMPRASKKLVGSVQGKSKMRMMTSPDALRFELRHGESMVEAVVFGQGGSINESTHVELDGMQIALNYGAKLIELPFALKLEDFVLDRYPGSMSPASYSSHVVVLDKPENVTMPYHIFMNHVLDYKGYRFFQSSYDQDELGSVLSVNHDPGTPITYVGYLLLGIGMFGSLFIAGGRFRKLMEKANEASRMKESLAALLAVVLLLFSPETRAAEEANAIIKTVTSFDKGHADRFGELVVQDSAGRMKPMDTLSTEILHKLNRSNTLLGMNANQVVLGMMMRPDAWREIKMIRTSHKAVNELLGVDSNEKYASFSQFFQFPSEIAGYKLAQAVEAASRKRPALRDKFDKAVLQVDERVNVAYMVYTGDLMRIWPKKGDANNAWLPTIKALQTFEMQSAEEIRQIAVNYFSAIDQGLASGEWSSADDALGKIADYQKRHGAAVYIDKSRIQLEIVYNHADIFERLWPLYFVVGFVLLFFSFLKIIKPKFKLGFLSKTAFWLLVVFLIAHTAGLGIRWYISGHAPWSNGYESMIYIAWASVLAGFIFSKNSPITLAATGILTGLILFVAHLNWMDPQVTNLVPVLNSYWLSIHVSMITASYGFLGLGALLGFIVLILFIIKNPANEKQITLSIKELNAINEMGLMVGLALLTVGNFLGGVWANESWGRYWGWDPKETWALVTILVYAVVVHLRFIKALYTPFSYAVISLLAFTSVLMTYFGVNYYLAGMHSYAKGDPVPVPDFVPVTYTIIFIIIVLAYRKRQLA